MDNAFTTALFASAIGITIVFLSLVLISLVMRFLRLVVRGDERAADGPMPPRATPPVDEAQRARFLQAAAIAVALARAEAQQEGVSHTPWGEFHRHRQLLRGLR